MQKTTFSELTGTKRGSKKIKQPYLGSFQPVIKKAKVCIENSQKTKEKIINHHIEEESADKLFLSN